MVEKVNLQAKLASFDETWTPKIVGELNGQYVKLVKFEGEYVWHEHKSEDEFFLVLEGKLQLHLRDRVIDLRDGEFFIVPRGVEHKPVADALCHVLLFEPATTRNTGTLQHEYTIEASDLERI